MPWSSTWSIRTSTIGRSPEIPCPQKAEGPRRLRRSVSTGARSVGSEYRIRVASRWKRCASSVEIPRWRSWTCACVQARLDTRSNVAGSRYLPASARALSRDSATTVARCTRTVAPGARRSRRRRLKTGSRTVPAVFESGRRSSIAIGSRMVRPRPRKRARSVSYCTVPTISPCTVITCAAQTGASRSRGRRPASSASSAGDELRLDEEVREGRMRRVGGRGREDDLRVGRHLDLARARSAVRERHLAHLGVVLRRDGDPEARRDRAVAAVDLHAVFRVDGLVGVGLDSGRLVSRRPDPAGQRRRRERRRFPTDRGSCPRASASRRAPASGCSRSPRPSSSPRTARWRAGACAASGRAASGSAAGPAAPRRARADRSAHRPKRGAPRPPCGACAPGAAAPSPGRRAPRRSAGASSLRGARWRARRSSSPGGEPCRPSRPRASRPRAGGMRCSRSIRRSRTARARRWRRAAGNSRSRRPDPPWRPGPWHREPRRDPPRARASSRGR